MPDGDLISASKVPCCPELSKDPCCERLQFKYRLQNTLGDIPVEVGLVFELERCPGPMSLGDVVYSTTLLPGERVRLYSNNRYSRFTYDSESEVSYRHETASDESFYMSSMDRFLSDLTVTDQSEANSSSSGSADTSASARGALGTLLLGPSGSISGSYSAEASADFAREISSHASISSDRTVSAVRAANSVSIGEVQSRSHAEGESESAYESSTRTIENKNQCHAVNYFAYQLQKSQTIKFRIKAVTRRVLDAAAPTHATVRPVAPATDIAVVPTAVLATDQRRINVETVGRTSAFAEKEKLIDTSALPKSSTGAGLSSNRVLTRSAATKPVEAEARVKALRDVDAQLVKAGVLDKVGGGVSAALAAELEFEITTCLPTQAILVKGCIDDCNVCEPSLQKSIELDLERKDLENKLLARQIELLDQAQEYRCCPKSEEEPSGSDED